MFSYTQKYIYKLTKINHQKVLWYKLSVIVVMAILFTIFEYDFIIRYNLEKYLLFFGLIISALWWYWTMSVLSTLLDIKKLQLVLLDDIMSGIKDIKNNETKS